ncbi:MAG: hypothetical protein ACK4K2_00670 [Dehalococcoidia bacterium]
MGEERKTVLPRRCPKCGGDLHQRRDLYGHYRSCLQCGWIEEVPPQQAAEKPPRRKAL